MNHFTRPAAPYGTVTQPKDSLKGSEQLARGLAATDDTLDAEAERRLADRSMPDLSCFLDNGPDASGINAGSEITQPVPLTRDGAPHHGSERLARAVAAMDEATCAAIDAEVARMLAAGERPDPSNFRDDGPDPLGIGFAWAGELNRDGAPYHGSERLARGLAAIDDAMCDEIDARVARRLAAGEQPDPANFRDDSPRRGRAGVRHQQHDANRPNVAVDEETTAGATEISGPVPLNTDGAPRHGSERLARGLAAIDDAMCDEIDAEVERRLAAGERPDPANFRDDGPDPLGTGFAWAGEKQQK